MDKEKVFYGSETYNVVKASLYAFIAFVALVALIIIIARYIKSPLFAVIGWVLICSVPFLFQKAYKRLFTRRVESAFDLKNFQIKEYTINNDILVKELNIAWADIQSYKCSFSSNVFYLVIVLKNGSTKKLSFNDNRNQEEVMSEKSVFSIFHYFIGQYNSHEQPENEIILKQGFFTTRAGTVILYCFSLLAVVEIVIHFLVARKTFVLSFMSFFIIIGLLFKRINDKALYDKINQLEPRIPID